MTARLPRPGAHLCCVERGPPTPEIVGGRELEVVALEIQE
jgi:hypothetical protein